MKSQHVEIMAPAGDRESLMAAIKAGADSVYFGVSKLNMRARGAKNFEAGELKDIVGICKKAGVKAYLTLNTVIYDEDIKEMKKICDLAKKAKVDAIIAMDIAVMEYCKKICIPVHLSTQVNVSNTQAVKFFAKYCETIVLARELSLEQIKAITKEIKKQNIEGPLGKLINIEVFVHGALCVSISGKCYMSLATYNKSANRGDCLQNCRRNYVVTDDETGDPLKIENGFVMSPKDLCTIGMIDKLIDAGVSVFKIEGRARKADYVYTVVSVYKQAVKAVNDGKYEDKLIKSYMQRLSTVFNRGFWENGYYLGKKLGEWNTSYGSQATKTKEQIGDVLNYYNKTRIGLFKLTNGQLKQGEEIIITGPTTGIVNCTVEEMWKEDKKVQIAKKGDEITIPIKEVVRKNDKLSVLRDVKK